MKRLLYSLFIIILIAAIGCKGKGPGKKDTGTATAISTVADTGFTGIKKMMSGQYVVSEITFKNGVRDGLMKTFYQGGQVRTTFWYENGLKQDSARWYYEAGQLFRTTPFKNDTVDGIQKQFYRNGKIRAKIGWSKGMRTPFMQEFDANGKLMGGYPEIVVNVKDQYVSNGTFRIDLELSDKSKYAMFYLGEFTDGRFDTTRCKLLTKDTGTAGIVLKKSGTPGPNYISVIASIRTPHLNRYLESKRIELPYSDLK
ncbi:MAG: hypothetical protein MUF36_02185 [Bacteroidales bacterium]|jgi:hypothetical protein|nr:hypothetical protein [Bacteroidales bacterium]